MINDDPIMGILGLSAAAVARHGPISNHNEATGPGKVFKYLPDLRDAIKTSKNAAKVQPLKNTYV